MKPIAIILAGGQSRRMGNTDKAVIELEGVRLIDRIITRARPQADTLALSAPHDYQTGLPFIPDIPDRFAGPAAGLYASALWMHKTHPHQDGFFTLPVDAPDFPHDLFSRLAQTGHSAIAKTPSGLQPTFAYWQCAPLLVAFDDIAKGTTRSLRALAKTLNAQDVIFEDEAAFINLNTPSDIEDYSAR